MEIIRCLDPNCEAPAEIIDRWVHESTDGPVEHAKTRCLNRHVLTALTATLGSAASSPPSRRSSAPATPGPTTQPSRQHRAENSDPPH